VFKTGFFGIPNGNNAITVVTREISGNTSVQRFTGLNPASARGAGLGDLNHDGAIGADDLAGTSYGFEHFLYARNAEFDPAGDFNADGLIDNRDLFQIKTSLSLTGGAQDEYRNVLLRRGNINGEFGTDQWDIDALFSRRGMSGDVWREDLDVDGTVGNADVDVLVHAILQTEYGDANYDKKVDFADFTILSDHFGQAGGWALADFTGDVTVDTADFLILCDNLGFGGAAISSPQWHQMLTFADSIGVDRALVPEPTSAGAVLMLAAGRLLVRRRRGSRVRLNRHETLSETFQCNRVLSAGNPVRCYTPARGG
jgi:hypothetical protein